MPRKKLSQQMLFLLPTLSLSLGVMADEEAVKLDELTITSTRSDTLLKDSPQVVTVITQEEIQQQMEFSSDTSQVLSSLLPSFSPKPTKIEQCGGNLSWSFSTVPDRWRSTVQPIKRLTTRWPYH